MEVITPEIFNDWRHLILEEFITAESLNQPSYFSE